jgi:predicted MFS family arabinose efflux permease
MAARTALRRNPHFVLLWTAQAVSQLGTSVSSLAYPLLVLQLTGSAFDAGLVAATLAGTAMVLRIPAGLITDLSPLRALMLTADAVRAAAVGSIAVTVWTGHVSLAQILVVAAVEAAVGTAFGPADFAAVRLVVPAGQRGTAVAATQSRSQLAGLLGPLVGGGLFAAHPALPFAADALSYLGSFACIIAVRIGRTRQRSSRVAAETLAGLRWLRRQPFLWAAVWWTAILMATFASVGLILVVLARDRGASPSEIGAMYSLSAAGGFIGAWAAPALYRHLSGPATLRAAAWLDAAAAIALLWPRSPYVVGVIGAFAFFLVPATQTALFGRLSQTCPDHLVGRAQAAATLVTSAAAPVAPIVAGAFLDAYGPETSVIACALLFAGLAIVATRIPA